MDLLLSVFYYGAGLASPVAQAFTSVLLGINVWTMIPLAALGAGWTFVTKRTLPRFVHVLLFITGCLLFAVAAQPALRNYYEQCLLYQERVDTLLYSCKTRKPGVDPVMGACVQAEIDIIQWPATLAFDKSMGQLWDWIKGCVSLTTAVWLALLLGVLFALLALLALAAKGDQRRIVQRHDTRERMLDKLGHMQ